MKDIKMTVLGTIPETVQGEIFKPKIIFIRRAIDNEDSLISIHDSLVLSDENNSVEFQLYPLDVENIVDTSV